MEKLTEAVADQIPAMVAFGKSAIWVWAMLGIAALALVVVGGVFARRAYHKASSRAKQEHEGRMRRYGSEKA